jgi:AcrR family transcriptional regulator
MINRERILEAAARVYAKHGFRGATTRLIANEAGVNEVTLFRTFGSKGALLEAVLHCCQDGQAPMPALPETPSEPLAELSAFVEAHLQKMRTLRPFIVQTMSEGEERPEAADFACRGRTMVHDMLRRYAGRLQARGTADDTQDVATAVTILTSAIFGDVIGRPMVPEVFPPLEEAATLYARCFLRMIGVDVPSAEQARASRSRIA